ncbi:MAG: hypothetical protein AVDCRST_MAG11-898, partial [uncultured Gemmatimonadaceae bacterium]
LTLAGVAVVALAGAGAGATAVHAGPAVGWGLVAGLAYAAYYLFGKRYFARYDTPTVLMYALPLGALAVLPAVDFAPKSDASLAALAFIAVVPTYLAYLAYGAGLQRVPAARASTVATLEPVVAAALAWLVWGERLRPSGYAGAALVLAGVIVAVGRERGASTPPARRASPTEH